MTLIKTPTDLIGNSFVFRTHPLHVNDVQKGLEYYIVKTDWKNIEIPLGQEEQYLEEFLPASNEVVVSSNSVSAQAIGKHANMMSDLKDILLDNIKKVKSDPEYAKQAQQVNKSASTLVQMVALEVQVAKEVGKGN